MTLQYKLTETDFLQYHLFQASYSDRIKRQRRKSWLLLSIGFLSLSFIFYVSGKTGIARTMTYYFLILGLLVLFFYPLYQRGYYKKYYIKYIADSHKNSIGQICNVSFLDDIIETKDITGEYKINLSVIENVSETKDHFYLKMKTGGYFIIPKSQLANVNDLKVYLKQLCDRLSIRFIDDTNWRWK